MATILRKVRVTLITIGIGSNVGDRGAHIAKAIRLIAEALGNIEKCSSVFETPPWGDTDQGAYLNVVLQANTTLTPAELLVQLQQIEQDVGRTPTRKWGPREIDLDILLFGDEAVDQAELKIPHPYMTQRSFVLLPLAELDHTFYSLFEMLSPEEKSAIKKVGTIKWRERTFTFTPC
jgi:2-amino-4-hydroxy-6-hydroxymethyldihydropteridine diphosphokinase